MSEDKPQIEQWDIGDIRPYENNPKLHPEEQVEKLAASIKNFKWLQPIVIDDEGVIIAGHGRYLAAQKLDYKKVPVLVAKHLSDEQVDQARLVDNEVVGTEFNHETLLNEIASHVDDDVMKAVFAESDIKMAREMAALGDIDMESLSDDINADVESLNAENEKGTTVVTAIAKAFGFNKVTPETSRLIKRFMAQVEEDTNAEGETALSAWLTKLFAESPVSHD